MYIYIYIYIYTHFSSSGTSIQDVSAVARLVHQSGEAEAAPYPDDVHERTAEGVGEGVRRDALSGHLHSRRDRNEDRPHRGPRSSTPY